MNCTLMQRLRGRPGATGNTPKDRKARKPEKSATEPGRISHCYQCLVLNPRDVFSPYRKHE
jgi:hypothetical protein